MSKAFWRSMKIMPINFLSSRASLHFSVILKSMQQFRGSTLSETPLGGSKWIVFVKKRIKLKISNTFEELDCIFRSEVKFDDNFHSPEYYLFYGYSAPVLSFIAMETCNHQSSSLQPRKSKAGQTV